MAGLYLSIILLASSILESNSDFDARFSCGVDTN